MMGKFWKRLKVCGRTAVPSMHNPTSSRAGEVPRQAVGSHLGKSLSTFHKLLKPSSLTKNHALCQLFSKKHWVFDLINRSLIPQKQFKKQLTQAIDDLKIIDPACGSGAFPMGILQELVSILEIVDPKNQYWKNQQIQKAQTIDEESAKNKAIQEIESLFDKQKLGYGRKLYLIENCIYGVDIQNIAIQISKLRFFISLLVDQKVDKEQPNFGIRPLPNLETKFVATDALIGIEKTLQLVLSENNSEIEKKQKELQQIRHKYFFAKTPQTKRKYQEEDRKKRNEIATLLKANGGKDDTAEKIANFDPYNQNTEADWFDPEFMFGVKNGFDIVIGNPPYIQLQKNGGLLAKKYELKGVSEKKRFQTFAKRGDIYALFYEKGHQLLKEKGHLCFITSNKWMRAGYGKALRNFFVKQTNPQILIDMGPGVFESATVDTNILLFEKTTPSSQSDATPSKKGNNHLFLIQALSITQDFKNAKQPLGDYFEQHKGNLPLPEEDESWTILTADELAIKKKIEAIGTPLKDWDIHINYGIKTGYNEAFIIDTETKDKILSACQNAQEKQKTEEIIKPILRGRDIKKYQANWAGLWVILAKYESHNYLRTKYPAVYGHLLQYQGRLQQRGQCRYGGKGNKGQHHWLELDNNPTDSYLQEFEKEKIVYGQFRCGEFHFKDEYCFVGSNEYIITGKYLKYIIAILNSPIVNFYQKINANSLGGNTAIFQKDIFVNTPIPKLSEEKQNPFEILVDCILAKKAKNEDTTKEEQQIDEMVFQLYGLTKEEIAIIKNEN